MGATGASSRRAPGDASGLPRCELHPDSLVRTFRSHGPDGPGVYPQCVPGGGARSHLLAWPSSVRPEQKRPLIDLTATELQVLQDAADGLTVNESAAIRTKSTETVKSQRKNILMKLGARNITQAVAIGARERLFATRATG